MNIFNELNKVSQIEFNNFGQIQRDFINIIKENILKQVDVVDLTKNRIKASVGQRNVIANIWWCGIFNFELYEKVFEIFDKKKMAAAIGYYVVYLFNEDKTKMYLSINQAAKNISKNVEKLRMIKSLNKILVNQITVKNNYLLSIEGKLSDNDLDLARDYELGSIVAIEYDLKNLAFTNEQFIDDLRTILNDFEIIRKFIIDNSQIKTEFHSIDFKNRFFVGDDENNINIDEIKDDESYTNEVTFTKEVIDEQKANEYNNRKPEFVNGNTTKIKRVPALAKYVLKKSNYLCQYDESHKSFVTKDDKNYVEAHHLVPVKFQKEFGNFCLDREDNIVSLCPICHGAVHYGNNMEKIKRLELLYKNSKMKKYLEEKKIALDFNDFFIKFYLK